MADDLKELRDVFEYDTNEWADVRREGATDIQCVSGHLWEALQPAALKQRNDAKRPVVELDELSQYVNQLINDIRQNKRAVKVTAMPFPGQSRPTEELEAEANFRANLVRQIEYRSNAVRDAYTPMFENTVQRSYGAVRIVSGYVTERSYDQELRIVGVPNPDLVTPDADIMSPDGSDMRHAWVHEWWPKEAFQRKWPKAKMANAWDTMSSWFTSSPQWVREHRIQVAEYWCKVSNGVERLYALMPDGVEGEPLFWFESELKAKGLPRGYVVARSDREVDREKVVKKVTNGYDILEQEPWPGLEIPIVLCLGKVMYVLRDGASKREVLSQVRLARGAAMAHNYVATCEIEAIGGVPRAQWIGYEGQFAGHETDWQKANHEPVAFLEVKPRTDANMGEPLPLPTRNSWDPPIQNLEMAKESYRRSIQSGMASNFLPTDAQNRNQKSGKALDKISSTAQRGSYHFVDHFEGSIARVGVILNGLLEHFYDTARDVTVRNPKDETEIVRINDRQAPKPIILTSGGQFDVTIATGPAEDSEREAASDFADNLIASPLIELLGPERGPKLLSLAVKLKNVGPLGDEMAKIIAPEPGKDGQPDPQQLQQELQAAKAQLEQVMQAAGAMQKEIETEQAKQAAAVKRAEIDQQTAQYKATLDKDTAIIIERIKAATQIRIAEINARIKGLVTHADIEAAHEDQALGAAVEMTEAERGRMHEREMAERQHAQALEQADAGVAGQMAMAEQQAQLQPPVEGAGA